MGKQWNWVKCDKCGKHTLTPYKDYGYTLCPKHHVVVLSMIKEYMKVKIIAE